MRASGYTFDEIARFVLEYTKEQGAADPSTVPARPAGRPRLLGRVPDRHAPELPCLPEARG